MFVTPALVFASSRLWRIAALHELADEELLVQYWHSQFWSLHIDSLTVRLLHLIVPNAVSTLLETVEILRVDFQHDDDNADVHFLTERQYIFPVSVPPHHLCRSFMNQ